MPGAKFKLSLRHAVWPRASLVTVVACWGFGVAACAQHLASAELPAKSHYVGSWSCSSVSCHGRTEPRQVPGTMARNEFATWMHADPHARANRTIGSDKFQEILSRMGGVRNNMWDSAMYSRCARCHDPLAESNDTGGVGSVAGGSVAGVDQPEAAASALLGAPLRFGPSHPSIGRSILPAGAFTSTSVPSPESTLVPMASIQSRGIGCESCHGPAGNWLAKHYERGVQPEQLAALGMTPTRNLLVRSQVCASCHVGSAENDLNHDMIAAGHPALHFEVASYHDRLAKHWPAAAERSAIPDFQAQLWAAGQLAIADAALNLLGGRAARATRIRQEPESGVSRHPWPEFSEYSCLSCHQRLRTADDNRLLRLSGDPLPSAGQPVWNPWFAAFPWQPSRATSRDHSAAFPNAWQNLRDPMQRLSTANAHEILDLTKSARADLNAHFSVLGNSQARNMRASFSNRDLTTAIRLATPRAENWEAVCQLFLALQAAQRGYHDTLRQGVARGVVDQSQQQALLSAMSPCLADLEAMRGSLAFAEKTDWPRAMLLPVKTPDSNADQILPKPVRTMTLSEIRQRAARLAEQIDAHCARLAKLVGN